MVIKITKEQAKKLGITSLKTKKHESENRNNGRFQSKKMGEIEIESVSLILPIKSKPKHRPRTFLDEKQLLNAFNNAKNFRQFMGMIKTKTITTKETRDFESLVSTHAKIQMGQKSPFNIPIELDIIFKLPGKEGELPTSIKDGDLDNHEKSVCDALNNILYTDDRLIVKKTSLKICYEGDGEIIIVASPYRE